MSLNAKGQHIISLRFDGTKNKGSVNVYSHCGNCCDMWYIIQSNLSIASEEKVPAIMRCPLYRGSEKNIILTCQVMRGLNDF